MTYEPIQELAIENYGCIRNASFKLSPLHALIGPNDSGKSTTLRALRTVAQFAAGDFGSDPNVKPVPFDPMLDLKAGGATLEVRYSDGIGYRLRTTDPRSQAPREGQPATSSGEVRECVLFNGKVYPPDGHSRAWNTQGIVQTKHESAEPQLRQRLTTATMIRFDPNALRRPAKQILAKAPVRFFDETGEGLASVYQAVNTREVDAFVEIRDRVRTFFPTIQTLLVPSDEGNTVVLQAKLTSGAVVPADALSEGLLYFLGFAALKHLDQSSLLLIEEPENGLHPARIAEVMNVLREISKTSQVVIATHSPLVVNELQGHEVSVVTRHPETGTQAILLKDVPRFEEASKVYQPGEFWLSYSDGKTEEPLLTGTPRT